MFAPGKITAYPTDTSFGLGVRADDAATLPVLSDLKRRTPEQKFSLMVRDFEMLRLFAEIPADFPADFFTKKPRTAIFRPTTKLPRSDFWPEDAVAFRVCTVPEVARAIEFPITATSANRTGQPPIFSLEELQNFFGNAVEYFPGIQELPKTSASEIWNFTVSPPVRLR